jgi:protein SCO1/2
MLIFIYQNGKTITQKDYEGKIYVALIFLHNGSICPKMTTNLSDVQKSLHNNKVKLLSFTVFPETDSVPF